MIPPTPGLLHSISGLDRASLLVCSARLAVQAVHLTTGNVYRYSILVFQRRRGYLHQQHRRQIALVKLRFSTDRRADPLITASDAARKRSFFLVWRAPVFFVARR